ncbi:MAG TPA: hypothetical protein VHC22_13625 [Pirellulales bacterium]|nr:hypothetical protein [Pirellulales bacterium]
MTDVCPTSSVDQSRGEKSENRMRYGVYDLARRARSTFSECLLLLLLGLAVAGLALAFPAEHRSGSAATSCREKDPVLWWHAQQLYRRDPEQLNDREMQNVEDWRRCLALIDQCGRAGLPTLTDDECEFVMDTLGALCPNLAQHAGYFPIYQSCRRRLAGAESVDLVVPPRNSSAATE